MSIYSAARGRVVGAPTRVTSEAGHVTVLVLSETAADRSVEYEVLCGNTQLGQRVTDHVKVGQHVIVLGAFRLHAVSGPLEDRLSAARITLLADAVALDLDDLPERGAPLDDLPTQAGRP
jgi:hypothetical protein